MKKKATIYLDETIWREFRMACLKNGDSASEVIEDLIREHIGRPRPEAPIDDGDENAQSVHH